MKRFLCTSAENNDPQVEEGFSLWIEEGQWFTAPTVDASKFGEHDFERTEEFLGRKWRVEDCKCGCSMRSDRSWGPVDPFGACPLNPISPTTES